MEQQLLTEMETDPSGVNVPILLWAGAMTVYLLYCAFSGLFFGKMPGVNTGRGAQRYTSDSVKRYRAPHSCLLLLCALLLGTLGAIAADVSFFEDMRSLRTPLAAACLVGLAGDLLLGRKMLRLRNGGPDAENRSEQESSCEK